MFMYILRHKWKKNMINKKHLNVHLLEKSQLAFLLVKKKQGIPSDPQKQYTKDLSGFIYLQNLYAAFLHNKGHEGS